MVRRGEFYAGSQLLSPLVDKIGLPIDQVNFLLCQLLALGLAFPFRTVLSPRTTSPTVRHLVEVSVGFVLTYFCFGHQIWHLCIQSLVCYLLMAYGSPQWMHKAVFGFSMLYLSVTHIFRQIYDYGGYTLDITGPMMIMTQKLTSLAFSIHDGMVKSEDKLSADQKSLAIKELPSPLTFYSYLFYFHGIMCGPLSFFSDYIAFIEGRNFSEAKQPRTVNGKSESTEVRDESYSVETVVVKKLVTAAVCGFLMVFVAPTAFPTEYLAADEFYKLSFLGKNVYLLISMTLARAKYYFAWKLAEALNNAAGFGFNGFDDQGRPKWDLVDNVDIYNLEVCLSLKVNIDCWNKTTLIWLRRVVYDRMPKFNTLAVFACSAIWHGFYPGYYLTFATGALFTVAARMVRRNIRPNFLTSDNLKFVYDVNTFVFTRLANVYMCAAFAILEFIPGLRLYMSTYWWMHLASIGVVIYFKFFQPPKKSKEHKEQ